MGRRQGKRRRRQREQRLLQVRPGRTLGQQVPEQRGRRPRWWRRRWRWWRRREQRLLQVRPGRALGQQVPKLRSRHCRWGRVRRVRPRWWWVQPALRGRPRDAIGHARHGSGEAARIRTTPRRDACARNSRRDISLSTSRACLSLFPFSQTYYNTDLAPWPASASVGASAGSRARVLRAPPRTITSGGAMHTYTLRRARSRTVHGTISPAAPSPTRARSSAPRHTSHEEKSMEEEEKRGVCSHCARARTADT